MNIEQPKSRLEQEKEVLFKKAITELAESLSGMPTDEAQSRARIILNERWDLGLNTYTSNLNIVSFRPKDADQDSKEYRDELQGKQMQNASIISSLWRHLEQLFVTGSFAYQPVRGEARMSEKTARELVLFLAKYRGYK